MRWKALLIPTIIVTLVVAACGGGEDPTATSRPAPTAVPAPTTAPTATPAPAPTASGPRRGGVLNTYMPFDPPNLDASTVSASMAIIGTGGAYRGLLRLGPEDRSVINPEMATEWDLNAAGDTVVFKLRQGVKFHDGTDFNAADVTATMTRFLDPDVPRGRGPRLVRGLVESVTAVDAFTVEVKAVNPNPILVPTFAAHPVVMLSEEAIADAEGLKETVNGTGPFKVTEFQRGSVIEWERNDDYYHPDWPYLDGVNKFIIGDSAAAIAAIASGRVHLGFNFPALTPSQAELVQARAGADNITIVDTFQNLSELVLLNDQKAPFNDIRVRRAIHLAIDRQQISQIVTEGVLQTEVLDSRIYGDQSLPESELMASPGFRQPKDDDIAEAKRLLADAGFPDGFDTTVTARRTGIYVDESQVLLPQLEKIGITAALRTFEPSTGIARLRSGDFDIAVQGSSVAVPDGGLALSNLFVEFSLLKWQAPQELLDLRDAAATTFEAAARREILRDIQRFILNVDAAVLPIGWNSAPVLQWNFVKDWSPYTGLTEGMDHINVWLDR